MMFFQYVWDEVFCFVVFIMGVQMFILGFFVDVSSFDIGIVKYEQELFIGQKKLVLICIIFFNEVILMDDL